MPSFGENLRRERELRGVSLRDIAEATKISTRFLEAIEEERLDILPGGMFPRSFVRQYARYLGLDAERIVAEFVFQHPPETRPAPVPPDSGEWPFRVAGVALAVLLGLAALWFVRPAPREAGPSTSVAAPPLETSRPSSPESTVYRPPTVPETTTPAPSAPAAALVITLVARQDSWVGVRVDGEEVLNRVLPAGASRTLRARDEIVLSVGNAGGLELSIDGRPGISLGPPGAVRHDIVINVDNASSFVAGVGPPTPRPEALASPAGIEPEVAPEARAESGGAPSQDVPPTDGGVDVDAHATGIEA